MNLIETGKRMSGDSSSCVSNIQPTVPLIGKCPAFHSVKVSLVSFSFVLMTPLKQVLTIGFYWWNWNRKYKFK